MEEKMDAALRHAKFLARHLNKCSSQYIIHIALKEMGILSSHDGFQYSKNAVVMLCENPAQMLTNGIYLAVGLLRRPPAGQDQVEQSIRFVIKTAWLSREMEIWKCFFPEENVETFECPSNRRFLFSIVDFIELWKGCCEEVCYERA